MNNWLEPLLLVALLANSILLICILSRTRRPTNDPLDPVRAELRLARDEARTASKELREEVAARITSMDAAIGQVLSAHGQLQQSHFSSVASQLREFACAIAVASDSLRSTLGAGIKDLADRNENKLTDIRVEIGTGLKTTGETVTETLKTLGEAQQTRLGELKVELKELTSSNQTTLERIRTTLDERVREIQVGNDKKLGDVRQEIEAGLKANSESLVITLKQMSGVQQEKLEGMSSQLKELANTNRDSLDQIRGTLDSRVKELKEGNEQRLDDLRREVATSLKEGAEAQGKVLQTVADGQKIQLEAMTGQIKEMGESNRKGLETMRTSLDSRVKEMQEGNEKKLEEMRRTVDEKLNDTLERRLGESFKLVSERLESVHQGLGEMQGLASGVGDLKRMLTNVKTRGTWAEVQLGAILEQMLTAQQFDKNVCVKEGSGERVEFAVKLPGPKNEPDRPLWLPIDSKFPHEDYARLQAAAESGDTVAVQGAADALLKALRVAAKDIRDKYVNPPSTTEFAIMFLATEGLYAEALRQPAFVEELLQKYRIVIAGPTTLSAILSSLRMGFQTLAVEQRAAEVWRVLGGVKTEFGKFGTWLSKVQTHLQRATKTIEQTNTRTNAMQRRLRLVEQLEPKESVAIISLPGMSEAEISKLNEDESASGMAQGGWRSNEIETEIGS